MPTAVEYALSNAWHAQPLVEYMVQNGCGTGPPALNLWHAQNGAAAGPPALAQNGVGSGPPAVGHATVIQASVLPGSGEVQFAGVLAAPLLLVAIVVAVRRRMTRG